MTTIDDYCLLEICQYLNIFDFANLMLSCDRIKQFASTISFPKRYRNLELSCISPSNTCMYSSSYLVTTTDELRTLLEQIGTFVEHLSLKRIDSDPGDIIFDEIEFILELFPNLETLSLENFVFEHNSSRLMNVSSHLKGLHLIKCAGIYDQWASSLKRLEELNELTVTGKRNNFSVALLKYCKKLTSLTIEGGIHIDDIHLWRFCNANLQSLTRLELLGFRDTIYIEYFRLYLPKMETFAWRCTINEFPRYGFFEYRRIKILELRCESRFAIDLLFRDLSAYGIIEELTIINGGLDLEPRQLIFNRLKSLQIRFSNSNVKFLKMITRASMPVLQKLIYNELDEPRYRFDSAQQVDLSILKFNSNELGLINNLVVSKRSLKLLSIALYRQHVQPLLRHSRKLTIYGSNDNRMLVTLRNTAGMMEMEVSISGNYRLL